jgi:hypothetical protein
VGPKSPAQRLPITGGAIAYPQMGPEVTHAATGPVRAAADAPGQTLARIQQTATAQDDQNLASYLLAAMDHYVRNANLDVPPGTQVTLPGDPRGPADLGTWLDNVRSRDTDPGWAGPILDALGIRRPAHARGER